MNTEDGIERFIRAQQDAYPRALEEIRSGRKQSHWMWFVFPQIRGLGFTDYNVYFGLKDLDEAREYLNDPVLGKRLVEISQAVLGLNGKTALEIFGKPDQRKLRSCMTLFSRIADADPVFGKVLQKYYGGILDEKTISILGTQN
ncbi:DUF1810 domain-containing protein [Flavobacterium johnsoniae]|uniref:Uncharacterized protein, DUF1810 family n=2 Tax=Flavobacterium TaxID=237 RepID=A0A1M5VTW7_FLAJO|nr:DUF1810 domain-containing protein [Flavobacterium johnsoniae]WJS93521.1 DUF1810 domain-containing protein [Flavobacterium johnsoniae]SHH78657.1 Uncharacterized protein, DUF1810 family [Flavobacterium johnsoniae]